VLVARALAEHPAWVRVNAVRSDLCAVDLDAVAGRALGIKLPKPEAAADVQWIADRAPGTPIVCAIDTARGVLAAQEIAPGASKWQPTAVQSLVSQVAADRQGRS
jgi:citrate lyase subunit beta / citryl-CoA lyase